MPSSEPENYISPIWCLALLSCLEVGTIGCSEQSRGFFWHSMYPGWGEASAARSKCWSGNDLNASTRSCAPHYHLLEKWIQCWWWSTLAAWWLYQCSFSRCMCLDILLLFPLDFSMDLTLHLYYFLTTSACVCTHIEHQQGRVSPWTQASRSQHPIPYKSCQERGRLAGGYFHLIV